MDARETIKMAMNMSSMVCGGYLGDLTDEEMMRRPHPKCNHIKWQVGHLIAVENQMIEQVAPGSMPPLPDGFAERYTKETASSDDPAAFDSKDVLMAVHKEQRAATIAALDKQTDEDLQKDAPESLREHFPTNAAIFSLQGSHWMMHAGQWVPVRRELGREILF